MFGRAIYLSDWSGALPAPPPDLIFTSLHLAEEFGSGYAQRARALLQALRGSGALCMLDLSPRGVQALGFQSLGELAASLGTAGERFVLRADFGFSRQELLAAAPHCALAVNASTEPPALAAALQSAGASVWAVHNFYPRPETGLDAAFLQSRTATFRALGVRTAAFISGDGARRGPLGAGLPTLEAHRDLPPYVQYAQLTRLFGVDAVLTGDPGLRAQQAALILGTEADGMLAVPALLAGAHRGLYGQAFTVRPDSPDRLARLAESRAYATAGKEIAPANCAARPAGSITLDNARYLRYSGELQITRQDLPADEKVNVIGTVAPAYRGLLPLLGGGAKLRFVPPEEEP